MTKEQAMTILELDEGFTYDDLRNAYEKLSPATIEFYAKHNGKNRDILEAYKFLIENKLYSMIDDSSEFTLLSQRNKKEKLQYISTKIEEAKEYVAEIYQSLDVFLNVSDNEFTLDSQISIFNSYPDYLKTYTDKLKAKAEEFKNAHPTFKEFSDLTSFINDYDEFNNYVEKCYKEIIIAILKDHNIATWNSETVFKQIFWQNINFTSLNPANAFYRSYISVKDFYQKVMQIINENTKMFQTEFDDKISSLFEHWRDYLNKYNKSSYHVNYDEVLEKAKKDIIKECEAYYIDGKISNRHFRERFYKFLSFYAKESANKNFEIDVNTIWDNKMKAYFRESFGSFFIVGGSLIDESKKKVDEKYGFNSKVYGAKKVKEIEDYIDSLLLNVVEKGQKLFYQIKALMDKYPEFGSYVRNANYRLDRIYQKFNCELLAKLKEMVPNFDEKELDTIPLNEQLNKEEYQPITSFDGYVNNGTYLVYKGHDITWEDINDKMHKYSMNDEQARMIFEDGIIFAKNVPTEDIKNNNIYEPTIYYNYCWTITDFDFEKLKQLVPDLKASNACELLKILSIDDRNNVLRALEINIDFSCFSYNYLTNRLLIIANNAPVYIGYPNEGEIMYSNNASLLREFCPVVYKLPSRFYSLNEKCYEKKDGIDLVIRSLKI